MTVPTAGRSGEARSVANIRDQADHFQQQVEIDPLLGRYIHKHGVATPGFGHQSTIAQLLLHAIRLRIRLVDFVDGHNDRHVRRLGMVDRFQRLRHHAVIRRHHDDHNVRDLGAARTHPGKGFVTRRVQEDNLAPEGRRILLC